MPEKQTLNIGQIAPLQCQIMTSVQTGKHWHSYIEINYILSGSLDITVRDQHFLLQADQMILINNYDLHTVNSSNCVLAVFQVDLSQFDTSVVTDPTIRFECNSTTVPDEILVPLKIQLAHFIKSGSVGTRLGAIQNMSSAYAILYQLMQNFIADETTEAEMPGSQLQRIEKIMNYIHEHFQQRITLQELSDHFFLTVPYLSKMFRQYTGTTFTAYLTELRLHHALSYISDPELSIERISDLCGFANSRAFVSAFRQKYQMLPSRYRKELQNTDTPEAKPVVTNYEHTHYLEALAKYLEKPFAQNIHSEPATKIQLTQIPSVSMAKRGQPLMHHFKYMTSIGKAKQILFKENQDILINLQKDIGFKYINFHGILDDDMMVYYEDSQGRPQLSFTYIDMTIDFLLSIKLRPFIELSFMPQALASDPTKKRYYNYSYISQPKDLNKWLYLIRSLVIHLDTRYGKQEVAQWPFLFWTTPDTQRFMSGFESLEDYFEIYEPTYKTVKSCNSLIRFGSPVMVSQSLSDGQWTNDFLELCTRHHCSPDFLNFNFYPVSEASNVHENLQDSVTIHYHQSPDIMTEEINQILKNHKKYHWDRDIYLTGWNLSVSHREMLSDTAYKAPYIVKNILDNYDRLKSFSYWVVSDLIEEVRMSGELFHGGLGLCTYNGIKKAVYYAFCLLARLKDHLLCKGDGYFITKDDDTLQILFYNYQHFSELYAAGELFDMTFTDRYTPFPSPKEKQVTVTVTDLPYEDYILTETVINQEHGSAFDKWVESGAMPLETETEIEYLKSASVPLMRKRHCKAMDHSFDLTVQLRPHEVRLIEIHPAYHVI